MRIHILSDIHNEFSEYTPSAAVMGADLVILAGDIDIGLMGMQWAEEAFGCAVLYVPGNHEFYTHHLENLLNDMRKFSSSKVTLLDMNEVIINGVRFLGATAWTNFTATGNPIEAEYLAKRMLNDFRRIRTADNRAILPGDMIRINAQVKEWLRSKLEENFDGKTVVITHHAPILKSLVDTPYEPSHLDSAFANSWDDLFENYNMRIDLWIHGHTHTSVDYDVGGTRVISNQRGYPGETTGFKPDLLVDL